MSTWRLCIGLLVQASLLTTVLQARGTDAIVGRIPSTRGGPRSSLDGKKDRAFVVERSLHEEAAGALNEHYPSQFHGKRSLQQEAADGLHEHQPSHMKRSVKRSLQQEAADGLHEHHHSHFDGDSCVDKEELAQDAALVGKKPMSNYCACHPGQNEPFSSEDVREKFMQEYVEGANGARAKGRKGPSQNGMKFLMLAMEAEQLTKGRIHFAEGMLISKILNRTFVLTNAGNSRVGYDRSLPLCTYFDTARIGEYVEWVAPDVLFEGPLGFKKGIRAQESLVDAENRDAAWGPPGSAPVPAVKVVVLVLMGMKQVCDRSLWAHFYPKEGAEKHPLTYAVMRAIDAGDVVCVQERVRRFVELATVDLMKALKSDKIQDATVVLVFKTGSNMFFDLSVLGEPVEHVQFAPHLVAAANTMVQTHMSSFASVGSDDYNEDRGTKGSLTEGPPRPSFLAVQWRAEYALIRMKTDSKLLERCVSGLVTTAKHVLDSYDLSLVFLAADITADGESTSSSFQLLSANLQKGARHAIKEVYDELDPKSWSSLEPFFSYLDNGIQGILDKIVCMRAPVFMYGPRSCGGAYSSFTGSIKLERRKNRKKWPYFEWNLPQE